MCKIGDIILVYNPKRFKKSIGMHSFVVLDDTQGKIKSMDFDFIGLIMSSMDADEKYKKLMKYDANFPISPDEQDIESGGNGKRACIKAEQFYYFNKDSIKFKVLGALDKDIFNLLIEFINELAAHNVSFQQIFDNM